MIENIAFGKAQAIPDEEDENKNTNGSGGALELAQQRASQSEVVEATQRAKRGMVLPFEQHSITFDNIRYSVDMPQVNKPLMIFSS